MPNSTLRIVTRKSPLAMWQAHHVRDCLSRVHPHLQVEILGVNTEADRFLDSTLASLGGKGAFVKELEQALLENHADLAVHSMKDLAVDLPEKLTIAAILTRENPGDAFVSNSYKSLDWLPEGSRIGTSSLRRHCQIKSYRPDLNVVDIRGNVGTRLQKLDEGRYDALVLASAGLARLGLENRIAHELAREIMLPAIGQGALGVEVRADDAVTRELVSSLNDQDSEACVRAERAVNRRLNGGCHAPIAAYAVRVNQTITLSALVGKLDGSEIVRSYLDGAVEQADELGDKVGMLLLEQGAGRILEGLGKDEV